MKLDRNLLTWSGRTVAFLLALAIVLAINVILSRFRWRLDLTEEKIHTLSPGTIHILRSLDQPVTLLFFFNESDPRIPIGFKNYARRVQDLLAEYALRSGGRITVEVHDPKPDSEAEEWAQRYGLSGQPLDFLGPTLYLGLVAVRADSEAVIPLLDPEQESLLEYQITRLIVRVSQARKPAIGVLSSLPVMGESRPPFPMAGVPEPPKPWFLFSDLKQDYEIRSLEKDVTTVDTNLDLVVVVHPKDLPERTLFALDQYLLQGGRLWVLLDPLSLAESRTTSGGPMMFGPRSSQLDRLLEAWGVSFENDQVVADLEASTRLQGGRGEIVDSPVWLTLRGDSHFNRQDPLTARLRHLMMPHAGAFKVSEKPGIKATPLLMSSTTAMLTDAMSAQFGAEGIRRRFKSALEPFTLALRLQGTFPTAFPEGPPSTGSGGATNEEVQVATDYLKESVRPSTVVLVADSDWVYDEYCVQETRFLNFRAYQPINDNLTFFINAVEQLTGGPALADVRVRARTDRPFERVLALQRKAQERFLEEERRLSERLEEAERRLRELQREKDKSQMYILSPKQKEEIEKFEAQVRQTKLALKEVRKKLRADIENLGFKVKVINILLMPVLVAMAGTLFGFCRRRRQRS
jgi:ABC-type uncharacterized transport system involved in gliding motility auxiliary subunit